MPVSYLSNEQLSAARRYAAPAGRWWLSGGGSAERARLGHVGLEMKLDSVY